MVETQIQRPITFTVPENIQTLNATHLLVQPCQGHYLLYFFECLPPFVMGNTDAEKKLQWEKIGSIPATCVARMIIAEQDLASFVQVLQQQQALMKQQSTQSFKAFA
jgi:hypothetical protein